MTTASTAGRAKSHLEGHSQHKNKVQRQGTEGAGQGNEVTKEGQQRSNKSGKHHVEDSGHKTLGDVEERPRALMFATPCCVHCLINWAGVDLHGRCQCDYM